MKPRRGVAVIFGVTGQDGAYLAKFLIERGLEVHGTSRDKEASTCANLHHLGVYGHVSLHSVVLSDFRSVIGVLGSVNPTYIYNLAAQSSVGLSFEQPVETIDSIMHGTINILEAMRFLSMESKFYNACSSECFGDTDKDRPADETTTFRPRSPYALGKAASYWATANYREAYGLFACSGLLFNHELPIRPPRYVTQKIVQGAMAVASGRARNLTLGRLSLSRDWGWAPEYVDAMARMLELDAPDDFVIATGETNKLEDFVRATFDCFGLDWREHVVTTEAFYRPTDIMYSGGSPLKAERRLGWKARKKMQDVVALLVDAERQRWTREA